MRQSAFQSLSVKYLYPAQYIHTRIRHAQYTEQQEEQEEQEEQEQEQEQEQQQQQQQEAPNVAHSFTASVSGTYSVGTS